MPNYLDIANTAPTKKRNYLDIASQAPEKLDDRNVGEIVSRKTFDQRNPSVISKVVRSFMRTSPLEEFKTNLELRDKLPNRLPNESDVDYGKRLYAVTNPREQRIASEGTMAQLRTPIEASLGISGILNPLSTAKALGKFAVASGVSKLAGIDKRIENIQDPTLRDIADISKVGAEGLAASTPWNVSKLPPVSAYLKGQKVKLAEKATGIYRSILKPEKGEVKNIEIKQGKNIDDYYRLAAEEQLPISKTKDNKLDTTMARQSLEPKIKSITTELNNYLSKQKTMFDIKEIGQKAKAELSKTVKNASELKESQQDVDNYINAEIERYGSETIDAPTLNTIKQGMWSVGYNALRPTANSTARKIGFTIKDIIETSFTDKNIKGLNELSGKYQTLNTLLENAQGRVIKGGLIGNYTAKGIGAVIGGSLGNVIPIPGVGAAVGALAGQAVGGKVNEFLVSPERLSSIASKKATQAGIVGKSSKIIPTKARKLILREKAVK